MTQTADAERQVAFGQQAADAIARRQARVREGANRILDEEQAKPGTHDRFAIEWARCITGRKQTR